MQATHPLHPVHPGKNECDHAVSVAETTQQICSNCRSNLFQLKPAFYCQLCDFVLCCACDQGHHHPVHEHKLYIVNPLQVSYAWRCNVCKTGSDDLGEAPSYHCPTCDFNMCHNCFPSVLRPLHAHGLMRTNVQKVYLQSGGDWRCDACGHNNGPGNYYPRHCETCRYDLCDNCSKPWYSSFHPNHQLFKADSNLVYSRFNGGWRCDHCLQSFPSDNNTQPYHCQECEYDLCEECMRNDGNSYNTNRVGYDVARSGGMTSAQGVTRGMRLSTTTGGKPITCPVGEEQKDHKVEPIGRPGPSGDDAGECVICLDEPKNATIVHGDTGHVCCCTTCAMELQNKGLNCPICRAHIDRVIKQYTV